MIRMIQHQPTGDYFKMKKVEITSKKYQLNRKDFLRGLLIAMITTALFTLETQAEAWANGVIAKFNWALIIKVSVASGISYLAKNFLQPAQAKQDITPEQQEELNKLPNTKEAAK